MQKPYFKKEGCFVGYTRACYEHLRIPLCTTKARARAYELACRHNALGDDPLIPITS